MIRGPKEALVAHAVGGGSNESLHSRVAWDRSRSIQHGSHLVRKFLRGARLLKEGSVVFQQTPVDDVLVCVARREQNRNSRSKALQAIAESASAHAWHHDISDDQVDMNFLLLGKAD